MRVPAPPTEAAFTNVELREMGELKEASSGEPEYTVAGVASVFPAASVARTRKVCWERESPVRVRGEVQALHAPPSRLHRGSIRRCEPSSSSAARKPTMRCSSSA